MGKRQGKDAFPRGGGIFLALFALLGVIGGGLLGEPTLGLLGGLGLGAVTALLLWLSDRRRGIS